MDSIRIFRNTHMLFLLFHGIDSAGDLWYNVLQKGTIIIWSYEYDRQRSYGIH